MRLKYIFIIFFIFCLAGCASTPEHVDPVSLSAIQNLSANDVPSSSAASGKLRAGALVDTALTFGAQSGLSWRSAQINVDLKKRAYYLRNIFNFGALMLDHGVQPPVLVTANKTMKYGGPDTIRVSDKTYQIVQPAQFVTAPSTWRLYLWMNYPKPDLPDKTLLPRDRAEQDAWRKYVTIGWYNGIRQADNIFSANMARMKRDYNGMVLYRKLLALHMISKPYVAKTDLGVTGDGNSMHINDQVLRITAASQLQTNSKEWKPLLVP
ncbi:MAG: type IV secretory system conjugative DNA transfer family protein [Gammaproteobacteria bacterium]